MRKTKKQKNTIYIILCFLILLIILLSFLLLKNPDLLYKTQSLFLRSENHYEIEELNKNELKAFQIENTDWPSNQSLMLVNNEYSLPENFSVDLAEYRDSTVFMNTALLNDYALLTEAVTKQTGDKLYVSSVYRSYEEQEEIYEEDPIYANKPGHSEHQTGLALDVYVESFSGPAFIKSKAGQFIDQHCAEYGFIIRYPENKEDITGIPYEAWHIRYVGLPHSMIIAKNFWTLEEYINFLEPGHIYTVNDYIISRQNPNQDILLPDGISDIHYSYDNTGYIIITARVNN